MKKLLGQLLFLGFTLVMTIALIEVGSRFLFPAWAPVAGDRNFWEYDSDLGWSHHPNTSGRMEYSDFAIDVEINSDGLRDVEYPRERTPGKRRMLLLGDSFGWGFGVEREEVFAERIEARHPEWEVINASVSGYGTDQEYLYYLGRGHAYDPDVVMLLFCGNDLYNSASPVQYWHNKPFFRVSPSGLELENVPVPKLSLSQRLANYIARETYFLRIASAVASSRIAEWRSARTARGNAPSPAEAAPSTAEAQAPVSKLSPDEERILRLMLMLDTQVRANRARLVVIALPGEYPMFSEPRFLESGIDFLPLSGVFEGTSEKVIFDHDPHWTATGHAIVSRRVEGFLRESGILSQTAESIPSGR